MDSNNNSQIINSVADGNTMAWMLSLDEGISHVDRFLCDKCCSFILEDNWNFETKSCKECN